MGVNIKYRPQGDVLETFGRSRKKFQIIRGPMGSGKTTCVVFKILELICQQRPDSEGVRKSRIAAIRNTFPDLKRTTMREFHVFPATIGVLKEGHAPCFVFDFGLPDGTRVEATVDFIALDRKEDVRKLRGSQYTFGWLNEMKELEQPIFDILRGRIDRYPKPGFSTWVGVMGDTQAWDEDHWLQTMENKFILGELRDFEFFTQPAAVVRVDPDTPGAYVSANGTFWGVNPEAENLVVLRPDYYQQQIEGIKDDWIRVNLGNEIGISLDGKPVHPDYQESIHRASKILLADPSLIVFVGCDFGLQPAAVFCQKSPMGQWRVLEEIVFEDGDAEKLARAIKVKKAEMEAEQNLSPGSLKMVFRGDPAGDARSQADSQTAFSIMRLNGVPILPASTNDPSIRRGALDRPLTRMVNGQPGILVSPRCSQLRKALAGGFYYKRIQVKGSDRHQDKPDKNFFSHVAEAAEYAIMDAGEHSVVNAPGAIQMPKHAVTPRAATVEGRRWNVFDV